MSAAVGDFVWRNAPYRGRDLMVLLAMADFASDDGANIFPSIAYLATKARMSSRSVQKAVRRLEGDRIVVRERKGGEGQGARAQWRINMDRENWTDEARKLSAEHLQRVSRVKSSSSKGGANRNNVPRNPQSLRVNNRVSPPTASILRSVRDSSEIRQNPEPITPDRNARNEEHASEIVDRVMMSLKIEKQGRW
jgi:hypothetical protein